MQRQEQTNSLNPPRPPAPVAIPINYRQPISEYSSVDYLDDSERTIGFNAERMRAERLRRFLAEPLNRVDELLSISSLTSEPDNFPPAPHNSIASPSEGPIEYDNVYEEQSGPEVPEVINPSYVEPIQLSEMDLIHQNMTPSSRIVGFGENRRDAVGGGLAGAVGGGAVGGGAVLNPQYTTPVQLAKVNALNQSVKQIQVEGGMGRFEQSRRGDGFLSARSVRQAQQLSQGVGNDVPTAILLEGNYGRTQNGVRRTAPTVEQRERLFNAGRPYRGDENGVVRGRQPRK